MANIKGIDDMSPQEISFEINRGGKFVRYRYCYSIIVLTVWESTPIHFVRANENRVMRGLPSILATIFFGWWGIPWGPIPSVQLLWIDFHGGEDLTSTVARAMALKDVDWVTASADGT